MTKATDGSGIDPYRADDFASGRIEMYLVTPEEMIDIRGETCRDGYILP